MPESWGCSLYTSVYGNNNNNNNNNNNKNSNNNNNNNMKKKWFFKHLTIKNRDKTLHKNILKFC